MVIYAGLYLFRRVRHQPHLRPADRRSGFRPALAGRAVSYSGVSWMRDRLKRYHYLLIVGCGPRAREMAALIEESRGMGLRLIGFVDPNSGNASLDNVGGYRVHRLDELGGILQQARGG